MVFTITDPTTKGMYVSVEWSSQPMYQLNILTLYLFDLCSQFIGVRKWRVLGGLSLNYRWGRSTRCGYKYTATVMGKAAEQWGRQPSGWCRPRAGLSIGCVVCTIAMASRVGWLGNSVRRASWWLDAIHVHAPITLQRLIIYTKTIVFIKMTTRDWVRKCLTICSLDMIQWHLTLYMEFNLGNETSHLHTHTHKMSSQLQPHGCFLFRCSYVFILIEYFSICNESIIFCPKKKCILFAVFLFYWIIISTLTIKFKKILEGEWYNLMF